MLLSALVLTHGAMHPEPVEAGVVRVAVVVEHAQLHHAPPARAPRAPQAEGLHGVAEGGVGEVEERGEGVGRVLIDPRQGHGGGRRVDVAVRGEQARDVLCNRKHFDTLLTTIIYVHLNPKTQTNCIHLT